jgi:parafibromin
VLSSIPLLPTHYAYSFEAPTEARSRAIAEGNPRAEDMIPIYRKNARYHVIDGVEALSKFGADAWDRVVCVMTTGQAWQFNKYQWKEPRELFHHG